MKKEIIWTPEEVMIFAKELERQSYNKAILDAVENAKAFFFYDDFDGSPEFGVNKNSILKLLKP